MGFFCASAGTRLSTVVWTCPDFCPNTKASPPLKRKPADKAVSAPDLMNLRRDTDIEFVLPVVVGWGRPFCHLQSVYVASTRTDNKNQISILGHYRKSPFYIYIPNVRLFAENKLECSADALLASDTSNETQTDAAVLRSGGLTPAATKIRKKGLRRDRWRNSSGLCYEFLRSTLQGF
jgi:hypothetical protein